MLSAQLEKYLKDNKVDYEVIRHRATYTSPETAASAHIRGKELAKSVIVKLDGTIEMAVLPSHEYIDLKVLAEAFHAERVDLATENDFSHLFNDCELGAMPPFGNLFGLKVYVSSDLAENEFICFNAGSHTELIRMRFEDFKRLADPTILQFATAV